MKKTKNLSQIVLISVFTLVCAAFLVPFLLVLSVSFSNELDVMNYGYSMIPKHFDTAAYEYVFKNAKTVIDAYAVTFGFSVLTMVLSVLVMAMAAYPLSRSYLRGRNGISFYFYFTMLFSGGLVPSYILITQYLHLGNSFWVYVLPSLVNVWYVFMMRTFFSGTPEEIYESALIDGANEYTILFRIVLPVSKPVIATIALFMFLAKWNDWMTALLYIDNQRLVSLQYLLQRILKNIELLQNMQGSSVEMQAAANIPAETVRMAMAIVVAGPALVVFPFFQKYFVKGLTVGSVKG